jgi:hypothetical protein
MRSSCDSFRVEVGLRDSVGVVVLMIKRVE